MARKQQPDSGDRTNIEAGSQLTPSQRKLQRIGAYIAKQAGQDGDVSLVPCPTETEWLHLSNDTRNNLPTKTVLIAWAPPYIRRTAEQNGCSLLTAWFEHARADLKRRRAQAG